MKSKIINQKIKKQNDTKDRMIYLTSLDEVISTKLINALKMIKQLRSEQKNVRGLIELVRKNGG